MNAAALVVIVATGATVRLTGSGLGCEHWPGCTPHHFEPKSGHSYIEFGNRVIAFLTILTTLVTWIFARGRRKLAAAHLLRHARAGAARRADGALSPEPVVGALALPALDGRADARGRARCGVAPSGAELVAELGAARRTARRPERVRPHLLGHARDGRRPASGQHRRAQAVVVRACGVLARACDGGVRNLVRARARVPRPQEGAAGARRARAARAARGADDDRRDAVPHAPAVVARARARDGGCDGVGGGRVVRLQSLAPA